MKEATGGTLLMGLAAGIIIIFIIMVAFFISYSKAFKVKNQLINRIEEPFVKATIMSPTESDFKRFILNTYGDDNDLWDKPNPDSSNP